MSGISPFILSNNARERFEAIGWRVAPESGCWEWLGFIEPESSSGVGGYGKFYIGGPRGAGRMIGAHRASYAIYKADPGDRNVLHACDNPPCVNPSHLEIGSQLENVADMFARGRNRHAERYSHELLTAALTAYYLDGMTATGVEVRFGISRHHFAKIRTGEYRPEVRAEVLQSLGTAARRRTHNSRLTIDNAREIRKAYAAGGVSQRSLAARYGTHQTLVGKVIRNEIWKEAS